MESITYFGKLTLVLVVKMRNNISHVIQDVLQNKKNWKNFGAMKDGVTFYPALQEKNDINCFYHNIVQSINNNTNKVFVIHKDLYKLLPIDKFDWKQFSNAAQKINIQISDLDSENENNIDNSSNNENEINTNTNKKNLNKSDNYENYNEDDNEELQYTTFEDKNPELAERSSIKNKSEVNVPNLDFKFKIDDKSNAILLNIK